jgi:hypothetical protein
MRNPILVKGLAVGRTRSCRKGPENKLFSRKKNDKNIRLGEPFGTRRASDGCVTAKVTRTVCGAQGRPDSALVAGDCHRRADS